MSEDRSDYGLGLRYLDLNGEDEIDGEQTEELAHQSRREDVSTPPPHISSPSLPSPMSLHHLGITLSPLRRQFSSGLIKSSPPRDLTQDDLEPAGDESEEDELTQDSKDILIQRLADLAHKLSRGNAVPDGSISALHARVDEMEQVLAGHKPRVRRRPQPTSLQLDGASGERDSFWGSPSPSWMRSRFADLSPSAKVEPPRPKVVVKKPEVDSFRIASEAEKLNVELENLVINFKARQEESEHIHGLLITRAERAAQRIIFLQGRVQDLEDELQENDSELSYLRLGLKAIEVQCPSDLDSELVQSIENWKMDWADLKQRRAKRKSVDSANWGTP